MRGRVLAGAAAATIWLLAGAAPALAIDANCLDLQDKIDDAVGSVVITMTVANCSTVEYDIPAGLDLTLNADPDTGTSFNNATIAQPVFDVAAGGGTLVFNDVAIDTATNATNGINAAGGLESLTLNRVLVTGSANHTTIGVAVSTGAVTVTDSTFGPSLGRGLTVNADELLVANPVEITGSTFKNLNSGGVSIFLSGATAGAEIVGNTFTDNGFRGALGFRLAGATALEVEVTGNTFERNETENDYGGALRVAGSEAPHIIVQRGNLFHANSAVNNPFIPASGGATYYGNVNVDSRNDAFIGNSLAERINTGDPSLGGAVRVYCDQSTPYTLHFENMLALDNSVEGGGQGGFLYSDCGSEFLAIELVNSTVSANSGPVNSAIEATAENKLVLRNTIVAGNTGAPAEISGFGTGGRTIEFSDVCPLPAGAGNICAPPLLTADGHETAASPTVNKGSNALNRVDLLIDAFGAPRIVDGTVDIGAAELQPIPPVVITPPDRVAPGVSAAKLSRSKFRVGSAATPVVAQKKRKRAPAGTTISYTLTEAAKVTLLIERKLKGRKVKRKGKTRCVAETRKNRKGRKKCTLYKKAGTLTRNSKVGRSTVKFSGRIGKRKLKPGSYRLSISAKDAAGTTSKPRRLNFTIVK